jgi:hypothetical protein
MSNSFPRRPQPITTADLFHLEKAHDRMVYALRQLALSGGHGRREAAAVVEAERRWDVLMGHAREKLDPGLGRDFV